MVTITARTVEDRIRRSFGVGWRSPSADGFVAGDPDTPITGIGTTFAPSLEVVAKAAAAGCNMIVARESPWWARANPHGIGVPPPPPTAAQQSNPVVAAKRAAIARDGTVIYHLFENWNARQPDAQLVGLAKALGWQDRYRPSGGIPWADSNGFFVQPPATLEETARRIKTRLGVRGIRIGGRRDLVVRKIALSHGMYWLDDLQRLLAETGVDLLVMGEPQWENELAQYSFDLADAGFGKGLILLGQAVSEDPGGAEMAAWLRGLVDEVPVHWIATGEPFWMPPLDVGAAA